MAAVESSFRAAVEALGGAWPISPLAEDEERRLAPVAESLGGLALHEAPFATAPPSSLLFAIIDRHGHVVAADAAFSALFPDDLRTSRLADLLRRAARGEPSVGLIQDLSGMPTAVCVAPPQAAQDWPMDRRLRDELPSDSRRWVLLAFAPMRLPGLARLAASAFGLSAHQARVAVAMLEASTLEIAAEKLAISRESAREALRGAMRKMGVSRTAGVVRRLTELLCSAPPGEDVDLLAQALDVTPGEARVAQLASEGETAQSVASVLGVGRETVKAHLRSTFAKVGVGRAKDLGRIGAEVTALRWIARASELTARADHGGGRLRIVSRSDGRRVAFIDHGPVGGRPVIFHHAFASGRSLPPRLCEALGVIGVRPIVPQRPGYGLTDRDRGDYLATAAEDVAAVLDALDLPVADIFARDIASAPTLAFASRFPDRLGAALLLNPEAPAHPGRKRSPITAAAGLLKRYPELTDVFFELLRRQLRSDRLAVLVRQSFKGGAASDIAALEDPELLLWLVSDIQAMVARTAIGPVRERMVYLGGWSPPAVVGGRSWTVAQCAELGDEDWTKWWSALPGVNFRWIGEGGLLFALSHPEAFAALLQDALAID
jgi:DNA-binding CsgD family transcriptional regulator/pimeloyl-ACP methyl ester carboxylesterase